MTTYTAYLLKNPTFNPFPGPALRAVFGTEPIADVVTLEACCMEDVFSQLNHGSGCELVGYRGRSLSVGDVVKGPEGPFMVDRAGWRELTKAEYDLLVAE